MCDCGRRPGGHRGLPGQECGHLGHARLARTQLVRSINEIAAHVAHGRIVHVTMTGVAVFARDDTVLIPIQDLAPTPLGLIWSTARENAKIRALGGVARAIGPCPVQGTHEASAP